MYRVHYYHELHSHLKQEYIPLLSSPILLNILNKFYCPNPNLHILCRKIRQFILSSIVLIIDYNLYSTMYIVLFHYALHSDLKLENISHLPSPIFLNNQDILDYPSSNEHIQYQMDHQCLRIYTHQATIWILYSRWDTIHQNWKFSRNQRWEYILKDPLPIFQNTSNRFDYPNPILGSQCPNHEKKSEI